MEKKLLIESGGYLKRPSVIKEEEGSAAGGKWTAPVWKIGEMNLNGRIYSMPLALRMVDEQRVTVAYDGHDVNWMTGEEYGIAKAVCSNPRIEDNLLVVDIDFVDKAYEEKLLALMEKGIQIGVSSVGYGEVDPATCMIIPESYELLRFLDFVVCPAGEVYAKIGEKARIQRQRRSVETVVKTEADEAMAERRSKVAEGLANLFVRRRKA